MSDKADEGTLADYLVPDDQEALHAEVDLGDEERAAYEAACARSGNQPVPRMSREACEKILSRVPITYRQYCMARRDSDDEARSTYEWAIRKHGSEPGPRMSKEWCEVILRCYENQRAG